MKTYKWKLIINEKHVGYIHASRKSIQTTAKTMDAIVYDSLFGKSLKLTLEEEPKIPLVGKRL